MLLITGTSQGEWEGLVEVDCLVDCDGGWTQYVCVLYLVVSAVDVVFDSVTNQVYGGRLHVMISYLIISQPRCSIMILTMGKWIFVK